MSGRAGLFVVIEGPSGVGKSTVAKLLHAELKNRRVPVIAGKEPSDSALGKLARQGTNEYRGLVLACLVLLPTVVIGRVAWAASSDDLRVVPVNFVLE